MGIVKWYKRDPSAALAGMMVLSLEERGAYNTILDLIYDHAGNLADDDRFLCGWLRCDIRVWRRIKNRLIELDKLEVRDGLLTNFRATSEIDEALSRVASVRELNRTKGIKSGIARRKINNLVEPTVEPNANTPTSTSRKKEKNTLTSIPKESRGTRLTRDFKPDETCEAIARERGFTARQWKDCIENFFDYWTARSGREGVKLDWQATCRNGIRNFRIQPGGANGKTLNTLKSSSTIVGAAIDEQIRILERETAGPQAGEDHSREDAPKLPRVRQGFP